MTIHYDSKTDLLYLRLDVSEQEVTNKRVTDDIVLDIGANGKIVGVEIIDASNHVNLKRIFSID